MLLVTGEWNKQLTHPSSSALTGVPCHLIVASGVVEAGRGQAVVLVVLAVSALPAVHADALVAAMTETNAHYDYYLFQLQLEIDRNIIGAPTSLKIRCLHYLYYLLSIFEKVQVLLPVLAGASISADV